MKGQRLLRAEHAHIRNALKWLAFKSSVDDQVKSNSDLPTWHLICSKDTIFIISICLLSAECYSSLQIIQRRRASNMEVCLLYFFCGDDENASVYPTIKHRNFLCCMKRLSFSSMGCKDGIYEEIKEHLGLNEPLGAAVSLLPEPCRPTADISLCHSHHSNVVISPIRSVVTLANTHPHALHVHPATTLSCDIDDAFCFNDRHLSGVWHIYSVSTVHKNFFFSFRPGKIQWGRWEA